jgi:hypothetical protein
MTLEKGWSPDIEDCALTDSKQGVSIKKNTKTATKKKPIAFWQWVFIHNRIAINWLRRS